MYIIEASAVFGKLNGDTIKLDKGLNIVTMPNEGGKSTWCAFLRTMLFGLQTNEKDTMARLATRTLFALERRRDVRKD